MHALQEGMSSALLMVKDGPWPFSRSDAQGRQEGRKKKFKKDEYFFGGQAKIRVFLQLITEGDTMNGCPRLGPITFPHEFFELK